MFGKNKKSVNPMDLDSRGDKIFRFFSGLFLLLLAAIVLYPVYFIVIASFSDPDAVLAGKVVLWPVDINLEGYIIDQFGRAIGNAEEDAFLNGDGQGKPLGIFADKHKSSRGYSFKYLRLLCG